MDAVSAFPRPCNNVSVICKACRGGIKLLVRSAAAAAPRAGRSWDQDPRLNGEYEDSKITYGLNVLPFLLLKESNGQRKMSFRR
eukprot:345133-Pleurochrysis_carterae.AAC.3